jgi:SAM-dependent methyltransferase
LTTPTVTDRELAAFYPATYGPYDEMTTAAVRLVSRAIRAWQGSQALKTFPMRALMAAGPGAGLDVGCGRGDLAASLIDRGWQMTGVEPSPDAAAKARARGVDAWVGTLSDFELEPGRYDAVVFQHSLEHTTDALTDLARVRMAMRPGGLVAITVPNFSNWQARQLRSHWFHLDVPRHRAHFTPAGLAALLGRVDLELVELRTSTSAVGLPASLQYALAGRCLFPAGLPLRVAGGLCAVALPVSAIANRIGGGGDQLHALVRRVI